MNECLHFGAFIPTEINDDLGKRKPLALDLLKLIRSKYLESTFFNFDLALQIFLTTAAMNCSGERSFSTLKRIKSVHRSTTGTYVPVVDIYTVVYILQVHIYCSIYTTGTYIL